jgi:hypothetical protein
MIATYYLLAKHNFLRLWSTKIIRTTKDNTEGKTKAVLEQREIGYTKL